MEVNPTMCDAQTITAIPGSTLQLIVGQGGQGAMGGAGGASGSSAVTDATHALVEADSGAGGAIGAAWLAPARSPSWPWLQPHRQRPLRFRP